MVMGEQRRGVLIDHADVRELCAFGIPDALWLRPYTFDAHHIPRAAGPWERLGVDAARSAGQRLYFLDDSPIAAGSLVSVTLSDPAATVRVVLAPRFWSFALTGHPQRWQGMCVELWQTQFLNDYRRDS
jgi:hypothetical protein